MATPVVGAARVAAGAATGGKVSRETFARRRREAKAAQSADTPKDAPTPPAPVEPKPTEPKPKPKPAEPKPKPDAPSLSNVTVPQPVSSGAGFILGLLFWTWIALPFVNNGVDGVRAQLKAKFTNKAPDGSYLP